MEYFENVLKNHIKNIPKDKLTPDFFLQLKLESEINQQNVYEVLGFLKILRRNTAFLVQKIGRKMLKMDSSMKKRDVIKKNIYELSFNALHCLGMYK